MDWRFWRKNETLILTEFNDVKNKVTNVQEQVTNVHDQVISLDHQLQKLTRLQYKTGKNLEEKIEELTLVVKEQQEKPSPLQDQVIGRLIQQVDEMDTVYSSLSSEPQWSELIQKWTTSLLESLAAIGVYQCIQAGEMFDPVRAEAVKTIPLQEGNTQSLQPYQIVEIFRRGFVDSNNKIIRKAQVVTVEEDASW